MAFKYLILLACVSSVALGQQGARSNLFNFDLVDEATTLAPSTTPIPILRFIDTQNPDGSYTYGYESGDGTYKIETRYSDGQVKGKYGYYDDAGKFREVEYGANTKGFQPSGDGLALPTATAAAPVEAVQQPQQQLKPAVAAVPAAAPKRSGVRRVVRRKRPVKAAIRPTAAVAEDEGPTFAHFDRVSLPAVRRTSSGASRPRSLEAAAAPVSRRVSRPRAGTGVRRRVVSRPRTTTPPPPVTTTTTTQAPRPIPRPLRRRPAPRVQQQPRFVEQPRFNPSPVQPAQPAFGFDAFGGHPAQNIDLSTGSFSVFYSG